MHPVVYAFGALVAYGGFVYVSGLLHNIAEAKRSGLPYIVTPWSPHWLPWQVTHKLWLPIIRLFPQPWWENWLDIMIPDFSYRTRHEWFARVGEAFFVVSPGRLLLMLDNAEAIRQVTLRREQFPKWTETYSILRQFGENVLTTEGSVWRMHRKVTSSTFNEKNAALVFHEAIRQTQGMIRMWTGVKGPMYSLEHDTMRLALNIIGYVGFGMRLLWPGESLPEGTDPKLAKYGSLEPSEGHLMSFADTMGILLENILLLLLTPKWALKIWPYERAKKAATSYDEYIKYMNELLDEKLDEARAGDHAEEGMDLMGALAKANVEASKDMGKGGSLTREEIIGNAFIMFVAGHETTANAIHFTLVELATNPEAQRNLHKDVDEILGNSDPSTWDFESLMNPMTASMLGACMYETLRLIPAVAEIPKKVSPNKDESITMDGVKYVVPKDAAVSLVTVSTHVNPRYWPTRPSKIHAGRDNLLDWVPERWFQTMADERSKGGEDVAGADTEDFGGFQGPDTNAQLFKPERGAYIPFSDGARSCLGRRIAQVEIIAALAVVFRSYSIELAVDEWASEAEVAQMSQEEKAKVYKKAQDKSLYTIDQATSLLTLKLHNKAVPVRVVKRGEEQFVNWL